MITYNIKYNNYIYILVTILQHLMQVKFKNKIPGRSARLDGGQWSECSGSENQRVYGRR